MGSGALLDGVFEHSATLDLDAHDIARTQKVLGRETDSCGCAREDHISRLQRHMQRKVDEKLREVVDLRVGSGSLFSLALHPESDSPSIRGVIGTPGRISTRSIPLPQPV